MSDSNRVDLAAVSAALKARVGDLARELFPAGRLINGAWRVGSIAGEPGQSLSIQLSGPRQGMWYDFAAGQGGDALSLIQEAEGFGDVIEAARWAIRTFGLDGAAPAVRPPAPAPAPAPAAGEDEKREKRRRHAKAIWIGAAPRIEGTLADDYLAGRGLDLRRLSDAAARFGWADRPGGYWPRALRYLASASCCGELAPAMVAHVMDGAGRFLGVHRTFLERRPNGAVIKRRMSDGGDAKRTLGPIGGGFVPLWRGRSGLPWGKAPAGDELAIAEGIENALTIALAIPELRSIAAISVGNLVKIDLPAAFRRVWLIADSDAEGSPARLAAMAAVDRWRGEGRQVRLAQAGGGAKDINDRLLGRTMAAG